VFVERVIQHHTLSLPFRSLAMTDAEVANINALCTNTGHFDQEAGLKLAQRFDNVLENKN
jgi:hypothetical protein